MKNMLIAVFVLMTVSSAAYAGQDYAMLKVSVQTADVRAKADSSGAVIKQVNQGEILQSRVKIGNWYEVGVLNDSGRLAIGFIEAPAVEVVVAKANQPPMQENYQTAEEEIRAIAIALTDYLTDVARFPVQQKPKDFLLEKDSPLYELLVPQYIKIISSLDPWDNNYKIYFGSNTLGKLYMADYGIPEPDSDDFLVVSLGVYGAREDWQYDPNNPEAGLFSEFDQGKNIVVFNGKLIRGKRK